jgi:hypothetical protein
MIERLGTDFMQNTVVVHFANGALIKGVTQNFFPNKERFHVTDRGTGEVKEVPMAELKAVFFVKSFDGDPAYRDLSDVERAGFGKKIQVDFSDGEVLLGYSHGFTPGRSGFFVFPVDPGSNNERVFVITAATRAVQFL